MLLPNRHRNNTSAGTWTRKRPCTLLDSTNASHFPPSSPNPSPPNKTNASPIDPDHPGRYYVDPPCRADETDQTKPDGAHDGYVVTGRYKLPEGLTCNRCIVQMVYCECLLGSSQSKIMSLPRLPA